MVLNAYIQLNVTSIDSDSSLDELHGLQRNPGEVCLGGYVSYHVLDLATGVLCLGDVEFSQRGVVDSLTSGYLLNGEGIKPPVSLVEEMVFLPLLAELERLAQEPLKIGELKQLNYSREGVFAKDSTFYLHECVELEEFASVYSVAQEMSVTGKPFIEGVFRRMSGDNARFISKARFVDLPDVYRIFFRRHVRSELDFEAVFGQNLYQIFKQEMGEPEFL